MRVAMRTLLRSALAIAAFGFIAGLGFAWVVKPTVRVERTCDLDTLPLTPDTDTRPDSTIVERARGAGAL